MFGSIGLSGFLFGFPQPLQLSPPTHPQNHFENEVQSWDLGHPLAFAPKQDMDLEGPRYPPTACGIVVILTRWPWPGVDRGVSSTQSHFLAPIPRRLS